jgi:rhamnosyltransferase
MRMEKEVSAFDRSATALRFKIGIIVPTLNSASTWIAFQDALLSQDVEVGQVLIVDSSSTDNTQELARASGFRVVGIPRNDFNHGGTRQWATKFFHDEEIFVYLTQDAIMASPNSIAELLGAFRDPEIGAAYGRQLPRTNAGPIETHGRLFNYPAISDTRTLESRERLGFKSIFISNSFAAYRKMALDDVGGFPSNTIFGEDTVTAARLLLNGWKIAYVADACAYHSHQYSIWQEFKRYFDIGVLHSREPWLVHEFGNTAGEGRRFVTSELRYLWRESFSLLPSAMLRTLAKLSGYRLGMREASLSVAMKRRLSMHRGFWR